jgi:hypothetical protein
MYSLHSISKNIFKAVFLVLIITGFCLTTNAKTYLISIPVTGSYTMGQGKSFTIDLGEPLYEVNEVRFICQGTVTAGLDYWMMPVSDKFSGFFDTDPGYMIAEGPSVGAGTYPIPEPFSADVEFEPWFGATWDFMLDGQATGTVYLDMIVVIPEFPLQLPPSGYLSAAQIQIDAIPLITGDFDYSGNVDMFDFAILASAWMTQAGDPDYNSDCDISIPPDDIINYFDLAEFCLNWLEGS